MTSRVGLKAGIDDFALLGGVPAFTEARHVGRPSFPWKGEILRRIEEAMDRRWVTNNGPLVQELEAQIAARLELPHVVTTSNGTVALELLARALDLRGEVIVPGYTFVATAHAFRWLGLRPVFCDVDPRTHLIDVDLVESLITERTSAVVGVHLWGEICDVPRLESLCRRRGLDLIFDAAHAFGCAQGARKAGNFGRAETFSFHGTKFFQTFEGGAVVTHDPGLAQRLRRLRDFGFSGPDNVVALGTNARLSEVAAAAGVVNLGHLDELMAMNRVKHDRYRAAALDLPGFSFYTTHSEDARNFQYVVAEVDPDRFGLSRDQVLSLLHAEGVLARRYFHPGVHRMEPYRSEEPALSLPVTERLCRDVIVLPGSGAIEVEDIDIIVDLLRQCVRFSGDLSARLNRATMAR